MIGRRASGTFTDLNATIADFTSITWLDTTGTVTGFSASDLSFTANSFTIDYSGDWSSGSSVRIQLGFAQAAEVPEPGTAALGLLGLAVAAMGRRQRARS